MNMKFAAFIIISIANLSCGTAMVLCCHDNQRLSPSGVLFSMLVFEMFVIGALFPSAL